MTQITYRDHPANQIEGQTSFAENLTPEAWSRRSFTPRNTPDFAPATAAAGQRARSVAWCGVEMTGLRRPSSPERSEGRRHCREGRSQCVCLANGWALAVPLSD
jgi:hypothetical protein